MTCPECGSHPHESDAYCTECGTELRVEHEAHEPLSVGCWRAEPSATAVMTERILGGHSATSSDTAPAQGSLQPAVRDSTLVKEMVGSERTAWIDRVWCSAAGVSGS